MLLFWKWLPHAAYLGCFSQRPALVNRTFRRSAVRHCNKFVHSAFHRNDFKYPSGVLLRKTYFRHLANLFIPSRRLAVHLPNLSAAFRYIQPSRHPVDLFPKTLATRHLRPNSLSFSPLARPLTYLHPRFVKGFLRPLASSHTLLVTLLCLTDHLPTNNDGRFCLSSTSMSASGPNLFTKIWLSFLIEATVCLPPLLVLIVWHRAYLRF